MTTDPKFMCLDVETSGLDWTIEQLHGVGVGYEEDVVEYYPAWAIPKQVIEDLKNPEIPKLGQNLHAFDAKFLSKHLGFLVAGDFHDTMILGHLVDDTQHLGLKQMTAKWLGEENLEGKRELDAYLTLHGCSHVGQLCAKDLANPNHPHLEVIAKYCKEDVNNTIKLFHLFTNKLHEMDTIIKTKFGFKKSPLDYYNEEAMPLERVLFEMEYRGIRVDVKALEGIKNAALTRMAEIETSLNKVMRNRITKVEDELYEKALTKVVTPKAKAKLVKGEGKCKFSWGNNNHFALLIYKYCDLPTDLIQYTGRNKYKTDKAAIEILQARLPANSRLKPILKLFSEYKQHSKIATTYTGDNKKGILSKVRYDKSGTARIYPEYRQTTGTGRLACTNPNMQNLKRDSDVKRFFIPDSEIEVFDDADYSQIELRTGAHLSQDPELCNCYISKIDVHLRTASRLFGREITKADDVERQAGKRTNFLTIFDGREARLAAALKADTGKDFTLDECKEFIKIWFETYPTVRKYLDTQLDFFKKHKFCISEAGRIRRLPDIVFGKDIKWFKNSRDKWVPKYVGPVVKRNELIERIFKQNRKLSKQDITEEKIGWEARRWYNHAIKAGYNQPIQGLAASITKRAMIALHAKGRVIANQVHDSLAIPRKKGDLAAKQQVIDIMENTYKLSVPVEVDCKTISTLHPLDKVKDNV